MMFSVNRVVSATTLSGVCYNYRGYTPKGIMDGFFNEESENCLSCMGNTYWSASSSLPNMKAIH